MQLKHRKVQLKHRKVQLNHRKVQLKHRKVQLKHRKVQLKHRKVQLKHKNKKDYQKLNLSPNFEERGIINISCHCDLKVATSQGKVNENFTNYYLKTKAISKCFIVLKCTW